MAVINPFVAEPRPPGAWIDSESCICGAEYRAFRANPSFAEAAKRLRLAAFAAGDDGGGFRSLGPIKWMLRVMKLERWYEEHYGCIGLLEDGDADSAAPFEPLDIEANSIRA